MSWTGALYCICGPGSGEVYGGVLHPQAKTGKQQAKKQAGKQATSK